MSRLMLLDTGPWVAMLDRSEKSHKRCVAFFREYTGSFLSTPAVFTEAMYLLRNDAKAQAFCFELVLSEELKLVSFTHPHLKRAHKLMDKYRDIPMDFADATLVTLAEEAGIKDICTTDLRGFQAYRIKRTAHFNIWPQ